MMHYFNEFWKRHKMLKNISDLSAEEKIILRRELAELANLAIVNLQIDESDKYFNFFQKISENAYDKNQTRNLVEANLDYKKTFAENLDNTLQKELIKDLKKNGFNENDIKEVIFSEKEKLNEENPFSYETFKFRCSINLEEQKLKNEIRAIVFNHNSDLTQSAKKLDEWVIDKISKNIAEEKELQRNNYLQLKDPKKYLQELKMDFGDDQETINFLYQDHLEKLANQNKPIKEVEKEIKDKWWTILNNELKEIMEQKTITKNLKDKNNMKKNDDLQVIEDEDLSGLTEEIEKAKTSAKSTSKNQKMIPMPVDLAGFLFGQVKVLENKTNNKNFCAFTLRIPKAEIKEDGKKGDYFLNCISSENFFKNNKIGDRSVKEGDFIKAWGGLSIKNYFSKDKNCNVKDFKFKALKMNDYKSKSEMKRASDKASQNAEDEQLSK